MSKFDEIVEALSKSDGAGKGYIAKVEIGFAWKVFAKGFSNADTMFKIENPSDDSSVKAAMEKAKAFVAENGLVKRDENGNAKLDKNGNEISLDAYKVCYLIIFKDHVLCKPVAWKEDRVFTYFTWKPKDSTPTAFHDVFKPALADAGVQDIGQYWAHVRFQVNPDPRAKKRLNDNGEEVDDLVAYIASIYPNEAMALKEATELFADDEQAVQVPQDGLLIPSGWERSDFIKYIPQFKSEIASGKAKVLVMKEWGLTDEQLKAALASKY